jgi:MoaA/NifB/PqqE/SkfB family radical SAM enzyme
MLSFHALVTLAEGVLRGRAPLGVSWRLSTCCTRACRYCVIAEHVDPGLDEASALRLVDALAGAGVQLVALTGGEPLLRSDLQRIAARFRRHDIRIELVTNGDLLPQRREVLDAVGSVTISLDGPPEYMDVLRGAGAAHAALAAADIVVARRRSLQLTCVVAGQTEAQLRWVVRQAADRGGVAQFQPLEGRAGQARGPAAAPFAPAFRAIRRLQAEGLPVTPSPATLAYFERYPEPDPMRCFAHRVVAVIGPQAAMGACYHSGISPVSFDLTSHGFLRAFRSLQVPARCQRCFAPAQVETTMLLRGRGMAAWFLARRFLAATRRRDARPRP